MSKPFPLLPGQTSLPADWKQDLKVEVGTYGELNELEAYNIQQATEKYLFGKRTKWNMHDPEVLRKIHYDMFRDVWLWAGKYRQHETNIGVLPFEIAQEVAKLCEDYEYWLANNTYPDKYELAIRFHHRLVQIHCYPNGNGRHARIVADVIVKQQGLKPLPWGRRDLKRKSQDRERYLSALKRADEREFSALINYCLGN